MIDLMTVEGRDALVMSKELYPLVATFAYACYSHDERGVVTLDVREQPIKLTYTNKQYVDGGNADELKQYVREYDPRYTFVCLWRLPNNITSTATYTVDSMPPEELYRLLNNPTPEACYAAAMDTLKQIGFVKPKQGKKKRR